MRILLASSEVAPFSKTGGLADVAGALPLALGRAGHDVLIVTPRYRAIDPERHGLAPIANAPYFEKVLAPRVRIAFVDHPAHFDREGLYQVGGVDHPDNAERFAFFSRSLLPAAEALGFGPVDVLHLNDWQTGLAAYELYRAGTKSTKSVFTIHNLGYQGRFPKSIVEALGLGWEGFTPEGFEFYDEVSFLKAGLAFADALTTVSPTYAEEIQTEAGGFGLDGILRARSKVLTGILNGIDTQAWNPATDPHLPATYDRASLAGKARCRRALCAELKIDETPGTLLVGIVSRLAQQKGIELVLAALEPLLQQGLRFAILGTGEPAIEAGLRAAAARNPRRIGLTLGFDEPLAHRIEAGADVFLMPSRYEPCGLNQLYSMRYGTLPIVRPTGGLADSVTDVASPNGTGFHIPAHTPEALLATMARARSLFSARTEWQAVVKRAMARDFSWDVAASRYVELYERLVR